MQSCDQVAKVGIIIAIKQEEIHHANCIEAITLCISSLKNLWQYTQSLVSLVAS